ncbi:uncharacterized protein LOC143207505 [Lasioglossum baleicum]|uniref:uncharacterized protein LOC143207505 n=1 Tax=Lasioglossum baleicum TaxID=434251 RepID=UPI003FCCB68E
MAAPVTKLLFLFLLGITSWSRYVAAKDVTVTDFTAEVPDGNGVIESWDCGIEDNNLKSDIVVVKHCPGVVQFNLELLKDGQVVNTAEKTLKQPTKELGEMCEEIEGPDPDDDSCSIAEGTHAVSRCDMASKANDLDAGDYEARIKLSIGGDTIAILVVKFRVTD